MSGSKILSDLKDLKSINIEMKRLKLKLKELSLNKSEIEDRVKDYLEEEDQVGVKYENMVILSKQKVQRKRKNKQEKEHDAASVLEGYGVQNPNEALKNILDAMKGEEIIVSGLQIKESKEVNNSSGN